MIKMFYYDVLHLVNSPDIDKAVNTLATAPSFRGCTVIGSKSIMMFEGQPPFMEAYGIKLIPYEEK